MSLENYLENKTISSIQKEIQNALSNVSTEQRNILLVKLKYYRFVDEIYQLHTGKHTRWLYKEDYSIKVGGIVTNIKFLDNGTHVLLYNTNQKRFVQLKFDDVLFFQKLSLEEEIILYAQSNLVIN